MTSDASKKPLPPYVSFNTFRTFIESLHKTALPPDIDRSVMHKMSGVTQSQLLSAMRFLNLIGPTGEATDRLKKLVAAFGTSTWSAAVASLAQASYADIVANVDIKTASSKALRDAFRKKGGHDGQLLAKSIRFYMKALNEAGTKYSPHFKDATRGLSVQKDPPKRSKSHTSPKSRGEDGAATNVEPETPEGYTVFPLRDGRRIIVPSNLSTNDVKTITQYLTAFVGVDD